MELLTHNVKIDLNGIANIRITKEEAAIALKRWEKKLPVPIPNELNGYRFNRYVNPSSVFEIGRVQTEKEMEKIIEESNQKILNN